MIQFARYVARVKQLDGTIILQVRPELTHLFAGLQGADTIISLDETSPPVDLHCPLLSLARLFHTTLQTIPPTPYLSASEEISKQWAEKLGPKKHPRIGLIWAGAATHKNDRNRSVTLAHFAPLAELPGIDFYSLQKGDPAAQAASPPTGMKLTDFTQQLEDYADTAGFVANLDLVISVDTAPAHLAGAMGKPVWLVLPHVPDWRWLRDRPDSPWYSKTRLFRQTRPGDWNDVMERVKLALKTEFKL
jgi:hypothetical protein